MMWFVIALIILCILLLLPVGIRIYFDGRFRLELCVLFFRYTLPLSHSKKKPEKKKSEKKRPAKSAQKVKTDNKKLINSFSEIKPLIPALFKRAFAALTVKRLDIDITVASDDPCDTAMTYGAINAAVYTLISLAECFTKIKKKNINISANYNADSTFVTFDTVIITCLLRLIICLIQLVSDGLLKIFM